MIRHCKRLGDFTTCIGDPTDASAPRPSPHMGPGARGIAENQSSTGGAAGHGLRAERTVLQQTSVWHPGRGNERPGASDRRGDRAPTLPPFGLADGVAAWAGAYAVMLALYHRDVTKGGGQVIDLSLLEPLVGVPSARRAKKSGACEISLPASSRQDSQNGCEAMPTTVGSKSSAIT